jgi:hypothetical protein
MNSEVVQMILVSEAKSKTVLRSAVPAAPSKAGCPFTRTTAWTLGKVP